MFFNGCKHEWDTAVTAVAKPVSVPTDDFYEAEQEERFLFGLTTVLRVCKKGCGEQKVVEMLGVPQG